MINVATPSWEAHYLLTFASFLMRLDKIEVFLSHLMPDPGSHLSLAPQIVNLAYSHFLISAVGYVKTSYIQNRWPGVKSQGQITLSGFLMVDFILKPLKR